MKPTEGGAAVTELLRAASEGDDAAFRRVYGQVYDELKRLAHRIRAGRGGETIATTALVHEAYLKLAPGQGLAARDRVHFMRIAARAMRQVLIDAARRRQTRLRGLAVVDPDREHATKDLSTDLIALDGALIALENINPRQARVVECRFFAGLSVEDTAVALDISEPTVKRDWRTARAWLAQALDPGVASPSA